MSVLNGRREEVAGKTSKKRMKMRCAGSAGGGQARRHFVGVGETRAASVCDCAGMRRCDSTASQVEGRGSALGVVYAAPPIADRAGAGVRENPFIRGPSVRLAGANRRSPDRSPLSRPLHWRSRLDDVISRATPPRKPRAALSSRSFASRPFALERDGDSVGESAAP